jgi:allantoate deiminase
MLRSEGLMATVGRLTVEPGVGNVIPGRVELSVDLRHADDAARMAAFDRLGVTLREIAERRQLRLEATVIQQTNAVPMDAALGASLEAAIEAQGLRVQRLVSGAGHDAAILGRGVPAAMLFVRCAGGLSHSPNETVAVEDVAVALEVLEHAAQSRL